MELLLEDDRLAIDLHAQRLAFGFVRRRVRRGGVVDNSLVGGNVISRGSRRLALRLKVN